ncbi:MAG: hypothetical protein AB7S38_19255 [Vulcanimicrobiota bacterium]
MNYKEELKTPSNAPVGKSASLWIWLCVAILVFHLAVLIGGAIWAN